ncbi:MAG: hypothetical protein FJ029_04840, partial [Actinobacteria bacterium]|nr:hypothetical protein [Actinomycetota bacterium]
MSPPIAQTVSAFLASLRAKVPRTRTTYATGVRRFTGWVTSTHGTAEVGVRELDDRVLEAFYLALVDEFGRESQAT